MAQSDDDKVMGRINGEQPDGQPEENLWLRLLFMVLIAAMISVAQTVLALLTVIQFIILLTNHRKPNAQLAEFGTSLGIWIAKAARYQTVASEVKPWPWTELD
ncbi:MAG: DUF4389 domain-containing protein [Rubellimicrobium sp.]|nr:DUF4389 domain-containing protein [Rubellimicrobium sp.]